MACSACRWTRRSAPIELIESGRYPFDKMHTLSFPLEQAEDAIHALRRPRGRRESDPPGDRARRAASDVTSLSVPESKDQVSA